MKLWCSLLLVGLALLPALLAERSSYAGLWDEDEDGYNGAPSSDPDDDTGKVLVRTIRGTKERSASGGKGGNNPDCRYSKGEWSECDPKTNTRSRSLTLKKGDQTCEKARILTKKCKKACRYSKGTWSSCVNQNMSRVDTLMANSDPSCDSTRRKDKRCKADANTKKTGKDRSNKKVNKHQ